MDPVMVATANLKKKSGLEKKRREFCEMDSSPISVLMQIKFQPSTCNHRNQLIEISTQIVAFYS